MRSLLFCLAENICNIEKSYNPSYALALHLYFTTKTIQVALHARERKLSETDSFNNGTKTRVIRKIKQKSQKLSGVQLELSGTTLTFRLDFNFPDRLYLVCEKLSWGLAGKKLRWWKTKLRWWKKVDEKYEMAPTGLRTHFSSRACCKPSLENVNRNVMQHWKGTAYAVATKENAHIDWVDGPDGKIPTERSKVRASWLRTKYFPVRPNLTQLRRISLYDSHTAFFFLLFHLPGPHTIKRPGCRTGLMINRRYYWKGTWLASLKSIEKPFW